MASRQLTAVELPDARQDGIARVLEALETRREAIVEHLLGQAREVPSYGRLAKNRRHRSDMAQHIGEMVDALRRAIAEGRSLGDEELLFIAPHLRMRALDAVPLNECLQALRVLQHHLFEVVREAAGDDVEGQATALEVATSLMDFIDAVSRVAADAYLEVQGLLVSRGSSVRRDLLEDLLAGVPPVPGEKLNAARACDLDEEEDCLVVVARPRQAGHDPYALHSAASTIGRRIGGAVEPLSVVRQDEIVVVAAAGPVEVARLGEGLALLQERLASQHLVLAIGVSVVQHGIASIPGAYRQACAAVEQLPATGGVLALALLSAFDYLTLHPDPTVSELVPERVRTFLADDARDGGALTDTLVTYFECDLNAKLAAERLYIHPNTAHYRLGRIGERTGYDMRRITEVIELVVATRLFADPR